ncbi:M15 family metallopeptidase [Herbaspirillum sp. SJZ107]|uniref:M15 family metallopeptidase n=1 Tax=Herbaspirillum sp. SJZ107 TaxID=2572881 RepID=UPI00114E3854|nr:M15 family metallopeptidase [Herbaspirillum sp. SJZ107]TQK01128.1 chitosanase (glycosyl hydrolase group 75) [Herbaspirillum sp. SJZ107]
MSAGSNNSELMVNCDLGRLAPSFAMAVQAALEECNSALNGLDAMVYEGYRSQALQAIYYQRGRTIIPPKDTVTNAPSNLHSWHGYGLAVDVVHRTKYWSPPGGDAWFRRVAAIFKKHGCAWGGDWKQADLPHFQWGRCPASPSDAARSLITAQGSSAVWEYFKATAGDPLAVVFAEPDPKPAANTVTLGTINDKGYVCQIYQDNDSRVYFTADADIDADGANGQNGQAVAYRADDTGTEKLANGGMRIDGGKVICEKAWARDVVILGADNEPKVFRDGVIASTTWYRHPGKAPDDPSAYVDAETVPYIVVPPLVVQKTVGIVRGSKARVTWNGKSVDCVVADKGPSDKIGELSIAAARALGIDPSPRNGGHHATNVFYELWPGTPAPGFVLQKA